MNLNRTLYIDFKCNRKLFKTLDVIYYLKVYKSRHSNIDTLYVHIGHMCLSRTFYQTQTTI